RGVARRSRSTGLRIGVPGLLAIGDMQRGESAALIGRENTHLVLGEKERIGRGGIDVLSIASHAPLHASDGAALADARGPDDFAFASRIERVNHAGFLSR